MGEIILKEIIKQTDIFHNELNIVYKQSKNKIFKIVNFKNNNFYLGIIKKKKNMVLMLQPTGFYQDLMVVYLFSLIF